MKYNFRSENSASKKTPVVILHGWGGKLDSLQPLFEKLAAEIDHPIYNLELPGFGESPMLNNEMHMQDYADFVINFLDDRNIKKAIFVGHSFGGKILLHLASQRSEVFEKLILINTSGLKPKNTAKKVIFKKIADITPDALKLGKPRELFYKYIVRERDYLHAGELKKSLSNILEEHYDDELSKIKVPTLIIWGEKDTYVPLWMGRALESGIEGSKLVVVPDATHGLPLKKPEIVSQIIAKFINEN